MARLIILLVIGLAFGVARAESAKPPVCTSVSACVSLARKQATAEKDESPLGASREDQAIAASFQKLGPDAIPTLVALLSDPMASMRNIASYTLSDFPSIPATYLPQLEQAARNGEGWLPPAIARIGSDEAVDFLVGYYTEHPIGESQWTSALSLVADRALPGLLRGVKCESPSDEDYVDGLASLFHEKYGQHKNLWAGAVKPLTSLLANRDCVQAARKQMLELMTYGLGPQAREAEGVVADIARQDPELREDAYEALISMKSPLAVPFLVEQIETDPSEDVLRDVASLGADGRGAGSAIEPLLTSNKPPLASAAARALGAIGYDPAVPALIRATKRPRNPVLNFYAVYALGQLRDREASGALKYIAAHHWYPPVRAEAQLALRYINSDSKGSYGQFHPVKKAIALVDIGFNARSISAPGLECRASMPASAVHSNAKTYKGGSSAGDKLLQSLSYKSDIGYHGPRSPDEPSTGKTVPDLALAVPGGTLVGSDRGEWGGELVYVANDGQHQFVLGENVEDIYHFGDRYITDVGIAHLGINYGVIYQLDQSADGPWYATPWIVLPGAPASSWVLKSGDLIVNTVGGGSIAIAPDGTMSVAPCPGAAKD